MGRLEDFLAELEALPDFASMSFRDQVKARVDLAGPIALAMPEIAAIPEEQQMKFLSYLAYRPPSQETPHGRSMVKGWLEASADYVNPAEVLQKAGTSLSNREITEIVGGAPRLPAIEMMRAAERTVFQESVFGAVAKEAFRAWSKYAPSLMHKVSAKVLGNESPITKNFKAFAEGLPAWQRDAARYDDFVAHSLSSEPQFKDFQYGTAMGVLKTGVNIAELAGMSGLVSKGVNLAKWGTRTVSNILRGGVTWAKVGTQAGIEGGIQFGRDMLKLHAQDPDFNYTARELVQRFGPDVVWNTAALTAMKGGSDLVKSLRRFVTPLEVGAVKRGLGPEGIAQLLDDAITFKSVDPVTLANAPEATQQVIRESESLIAAGKIPHPQVDDILKAHTGLTNYDVEAISGGRYLLRPKTPGPRLVFNSREKLENWLSTEMATRIQSQAKAEAAEMGASFAASKSLGVEYSSDWVDTLAIQKYGTGLASLPGGKYQLSYFTDDGVAAVESFDNLADAGDFLLRGSIRGGKLDAMLAPDTAVIDDTAKRLVFKGTTVVGDRFDVYNHLSAYADRPVAKEVEYLKTDRGETVYNKVNHWELHDPKSGYRRKFDDLTEMKTWLQTAEDDYLKIEQMAADKAYGFDYHAGNYVLYRGEGAPLTFETKQAVLDALKATPIPKVAPTLLGIPQVADDALYVAGVDLVDRPFGWKHKTLAARAAARPAMREAGVGFQARKLLSPAPTLVERAVQKLGASDDLAKAVRETKTAVDLVTAQDGALYRLADEAYALRGRKPLKGYDTEKLRPLLEQKTRAEAVAFLAERGNGLDPKYIEYYDQFRDVMGKTSREGMAGYGQIGRRMAEGRFEEGYVTRLHQDAGKIRAWFRSHPKDFFDESDIQRVLKDAGIDESHLVYFRNARKRDLTSLGAMYTNPLDSTKAIMHYMNKEKFLNPALVNLKAVVNTEFAAGRIPEALKNYLLGEGGLMDMIDGKLLSWEFREAEAAVTKGFNKIIRTITAPLKGVGLQPREIKSLASLYTNLTYSATLGFRVYPLARNLFTQPLLMMGPWLGNDYLVMGWKALANDDGRIYNTLVKKGILLPEGSGSIWTGGLKAPGLGAYRKIDDVTRAVGWFQSKIRFDEAVSLVRSGKITSDVTFLKRSGVWTMSDDIQRGVLERVKAGKWDVAQDLFSRAYIQETLFPASRALNPVLLRGKSFVGRLFGTFGMFPAWFADGLQNRLIRRGSFADKIGFASRLALNSAAASGLAINLGLREKDWTPWGAANWSGGPYAQIMALGLMSRQPGYQGRAARAQLYGATTQGVSAESFWNSQAGKWLVPMPGRVQLSYFDRASKHFEKGDHWQGWLSIMGAPVNPDWKGW